MATPKSTAAAIAVRNPQSSADSPRRTGPPWRWSMPRATAMIAPYSGPTTMAPTTRICELVRIPTAAMSPAITSRTKKLGG